MPWWAWTFIGAAVAYALVFYMVLKAHEQTPVTPELARWRAALWPIFLTTGWLQGERLPMD